ncbi:hypothetical protein CLOM_g8400 [Closterium sp. NIES-68]|nr:hypothetical protein CLOM_g8400 [Closterium sp. NIES-68]
MVARALPAARGDRGGASGAFVSTQALLAFALSLLLLRSYNSRRAVRGEPWLAVFPWGCALQGTEGGVAGRLVVGRGGGAAVEEGAVGGGGSEDDGVDGGGDSSGGGDATEASDTRQVPAVAAAAVTGDALAATTVAMEEGGVSGNTRTSDGAIPAVGASQPTIAAAGASADIANALLGRNASTGPSESEPKRAPTDQSACDSAVAEEDVRRGREEEQAAFGRVEVEVGRGGVGEARVNEETCFNVRALDVNGRAFDDACRQRAFLVAFIAGGSSSSSSSSSDSSSSGSGGEEAFLGGIVPSQGSVRLTEAHIPQSPEERAARIREMEEAGEREEEGRADIRMAPRVTYHPTNSSHRVCFHLPLPGRYGLSLHLLFSSTFRLLRSNARGSNDGGFNNYTIVHSQTIHASAAPNYSLQEHRKSLPLCTPSLLAASHHAGFWASQLWRPHACRLHRLSPPAIARCFHARSVLLLGDSQVRYTFGFLRFFLRFPSREAFLRKLAVNPTVSRTQPNRAVDRPR